MNKAMRTLTIIALAAIMAAPVGAWGPTTETAIVTSAAHLLSREGGVPLSNLERDVRGGAGMPENALRDMVDNIDEDLVGAIESEMRLLQAARGQRVDPYFAYRLGVLGKLVARATAPLQDAPSAIRNQYFEDVDGSIQGVSMRSKRRAQVEPRAYFAEVRREARARDDVLIEDYRAGLGFGGVARSALSEDASRSVNAVADVWHTVLRQQASAASAPSGRMAEYIVGAIEFYVYRGNMREADTAYERLAAHGLDSAEMLERVGDVFLEAGREERAMREYEAVLDKAPEARHVARKVADYYLEVGEEALEAGRLEDAREAFDEAANVDQLHEGAQARLVEAEREISARRDRHERAVAALEEAESLRGRAEQRAENRDYAAAIDLFRQARSKFEDVPDEFPAVVREAQLGLNTIEARMRGLQENIVTSASELSGSGSGLDPRAFARTDATRGDREALESLLNRQYENEIQRLRERMEQEMLNER